jgi:hypothetical protein
LLEEFARKHARAFASVSDGRTGNSIGPVPEKPITNTSNDRRLAAA